MERAPTQGEYPERESLVDPLVATGILAGLLAVVLLIGPRTQIV